MWLLMCLFINSRLVELKSQEFLGHSNSSTVPEVLTTGATPVNEEGNLVSAKAEIRTHDSVVLSPLCL